jgi:acetyl-CoA carboxylase biotin carboxyl carrier protein
MRQERGAGFIMEFQQIKELISLVNASDITDLEIQNQDFRIRIRKEQKENPVVVQSLAKVDEEQVIPRGEKVVEEGLVAITSPMVGTFYRAPAPDADPFIRVGETITPGQVLYIIEAMKMMNEIESDIGGVVKQILVENGEPVEYGQPLLLIDPKA